MIHIRRFLRIFSSDSSSIIDSLETSVTMDIDLDKTVDNNAKEFVVPLVEDAEVIGD